MRESCSHEKAEQSLGYGVLLCTERAQDPLGELMGKVRSDLCESTLPGRSVMEYCVSSHIQGSCQGCSVMEYCVNSHIQGSCQGRGVVEY